MTKLAKRVISMSLATLSILSLVSLPSNATDTISKEVIELNGNNPDNIRYRLNVDIDLNTEAYQNGYIVGDGNFNFNPNQTLTRAEFATMLNKIFKFTGTMESGDNLIKFEDTVGHWAEEAIFNLQKMNLIAGTSETTFHPDMGLTREHVLLILGKMLNYSNLGYNLAETSWIDDTFHPETMRKILGTKILDIDLENYDVKQPITRAETVHILNEIIYPDEFRADGKVEYLRSREIFLDVLDSNCPYRRDCLLALDLNKIKSVYESDEHLKHVEANLADDEILIKYKVYKSISNRAAITGPLYQIVKTSELVDGWMPTYPTVNVKLGYKFDFWFFEFDGRPYNIGESEYKRLLDDHEDGINVVEYLVTVGNNSYEQSKYIYYTSGDLKLYLKEEDKDDKSSAPILSKSSKEPLVFTTKSNLVHIPSVVGDDVKYSDLYGWRDRSTGNIIYLYDGGVWSSEGYNVSYEENGVAVYEFELITVEDYEKSLNK